MVLSAWLMDKSPISILGETIGKRRKPKREEKLPMQFW
jgi:hypothetical protein